MTAGYSGTPLARKLGLKRGMTVRLLNPPEVMAAGHAVGLVDVEVCAVDETWSGLKFVIPVADREA